MKQNQNADLKDMLQKLSEEIEALKKAVKRQDAKIRRLTKRLDETVEEQEYISYRSFWQY